MPDPDPARRIGVTLFSQFIRLENCERFLRFRIFPEEVKAYRKKWDITEQPLTPLSKDSGSEFEKNVDRMMVKRGEVVVDLKGKDDPEITISELKKVDLDVFENPVIWKRLYYQYASQELHHSLRGGVPVWVKGTPATELRAARMAN